MAAAWGGWAVLFYHPTRYSTELGQVRRVQFPDGSLAAINTDSTVSVDMNQTLRSIELTKGEAWFEVVKDARRPFVVAAGRVRARAVGTAFSVRRHDDGADVLVTEGTVETWIVGQQERSRLTAGMRAFVADYAPPQPVARPAEIERALAWRDGQISLEGERLADAVEEFNRYNTKKLVIVDPNLAEERLVGRFSIHEPIAFARAVQSALGATVSEDHDTIQLARR
jgi:transmembrane sensor